MIHTLTVNVSDVVAVLCAAGALGWWLRRYQVERSGRNNNASCQRILYTVEYPDGDPLDNGDSGYSVWKTRAEAEDALTNLSEQHDAGLRVVEYIEKKPNR